LTGEAPSRGGGGRAVAGLATCAVLLAAVAGALIGWKSAGHLETLWDEHVDREIAVGLARNPLVGERPTIDPSQTRLPMYVNAAVFALTGRDDLPTSRAVSLVVGAATVLATAMLGRMLFGPMVGAIAALLLAFSPYFLSFVRISMTEGDVFFACFLTVSVWGLARYRARPTAGRWIAAAVLMGLAVGAKVFAVVPLAVLLIDAALSNSARPVIGSTAQADGKAVFVLVVVGAAAAVVGAVAAWISPLACTPVWALLTGLWAYTIWFAARKRAFPTRPGSAMIGLILLAIITFCAIMPVHLTAHEIVRTIVGRLFRWDHQAPLVHWADHLRLYAGIVLIKLTVPLGVITVAAVVYGLTRIRRDGAWRVCLLPTLGYIAAICFLPLRQTFYLMGVYPLLMLMTAAVIAAAGRRLWRWSRLGDAGWVVVVTSLLIHLAISDYRAFPWFHLYAYELIGNRWLGAESRGYRNLIQTPSDGVESLIRWCNTDPRVRPGSRVVSFLWEDQPGQMVDDLLPASPQYVLVRRGLTSESAAVPAAPSIENADFVLLHINNLLGYGDRPPDHPPLDLLNGEFEPVYTVRRGVLDIGWVYARRSKGEGLGQGNGPHPGCDSQLLFHTPIPAETSCVPVSTLGGLLRHYYRAAA